MRMIAITAAAAALAVPVIGQSPSAVSGAVERQIVERQLVEARAAVESRFTTGAPYSGEAVTETVQVLSDGNRIARKTTTRIYRDSEGRSRREQISSTGDVQSINISDPVANSTFVLNPATRTAQRAGVFVATGRGGTYTAAVPAAGGTVTVAGGGARGRGGATVSPEEEARKREVEAQAAAGRSGGEPPVSIATIVYPAEGVSLPRTAAPSGFAGSNNVKREDLGTQIVEGVAASGTRTTTTIPAGAIGNERAIEIVSEQWLSTELKVLVTTKHSDPRTGETTYRLTNIVQAEPARSLFEVPADYTIKDAQIRRQSPIPQQN